MSGRYDRVPKWVRFEIRTGHDWFNDIKIAPMISRLPRSLLTLAQGFDTIW
jgi:hypothetical protein